MKTGIEVVAASRARMADVGEADVKGDDKWLAATAASFADAYSRTTVGDASSDLQNQRQKLLLIEAAALLVVVIDHLLRLETKGASDVEEK